MRNNNLIQIITVICAFLSLSPANGKAEDSTLQATEYELMSMLISEEYETEFSLIVICSDTEPWCLAGGLGVLREEWHGLKPETIDALIMANSGETCRLEDSFELPVDYRLVSEGDYMKTLMGGPDGSESATLDAGAEGSAGMDAYAAISGAAEPDWDSFDEAYPDAQGYLSFSRIGFDAERTQALVIFSNAYRCSGARTRPATRRIAFFVKREGSWELVGVSGNIRAMR